MAQHERVTKATNERPNRSDHHRQHDIETTSDQQHARDHEAPPLSETCFQPGMDEHVAAVTQARSQSQLADLVLHLQKTYGNSYVQRLLSSLPIQAKMTVSAPGDIYEQEAERVADKVTRAISSQAQRQPEEEEEELQAALQRQEEGEEEEELQMQPVEDEEEEELQMQPVEEEEEELQAKLAPEIYRQEEEETEEEEPAMPQASGVERQGEETPIHGRYSAVQEGVVAQDLEDRIKRARGAGQPLNESVRASFEPHFGRDFGSVRVHTDSEADVLSQRLGARAFTTEQDIFFREGAYQPDTDAGKGLLAHELTHVAQQSSHGLAPQVQGIFKRLKKGLKKLGQKIKKGAKKAWGGVKKAGKAIKKGAKKVWGGLKKVGSWTWDKAKGIFNRAKQWVTKLPGRLKRFFSHIWEGVKSLKPWSLDWWKSLGDVGTWKDFGIWLGKAAIYAIEVTPIPELLETIADIIKFNTRPLSDTEKALAQPIFSDKIDYSTVRVDERSFVVRWTKRPYVSLNVINAWGELPQHTLLHELTHVWQYQNMGAVYIPKAIAAQQMKDGYKYGAAEDLEKHKSEGMKAFNLEQQASIVEDYDLLRIGKEPNHSKCKSADLPHFKVYIDNIKA